MLSKHSAQVLLETSAACSRWTIQMGDLLIWAYVTAQLGAIMGKTNEKVVNSTPNNLLTQFKQYSAFTFAWRDMDRLPF